jgi:hypothetical protein
VQPGANWTCRNGNWLPPGEPEPDAEFASLSPSKSPFMLARFIAPGAVAFRGSGLGIT